MCFATKKIPASLFKCRIIVSLVLVLTVGVLAVIAASGEDDLRNYPDCLACGANREACAYSRMVVEYVDGSRRGDCGLHCVAEDLIFQPGRRPTRFLVADYNTKKMIKADNACWVIYDNGNDCKSNTAMLAFRKQEDAERFVRAYGGLNTNFEGAMRLAYAKIYAELKQDGYKRH